MRRIRRGDLYWADPGPVVGHEQAGHRPMLVLSHPPLQDHLGVAVVASVTTRKPRGPFPLSVRLATGGLQRESWALAWQIRTVSVERLGRRIGRVEPAEVDRVAEGLAEILG